MYSLEQTLNKPVINFPVFSRHLEYWGDRGGSWGELCVTFPVLPPFLQVWISFAQFEASTGTDESMEQARFVDEKKCNSS